MKKTMILIIVIIMSLSCSTDESRALTDVEKYIQMVKSNAYIVDTLPTFSSEAIPVLLESALDFTVISNFPVNPISSQICPNKTVGECLLWTVEHIRLNYNNCAVPVCYPSLLPKLMDKSTASEVDNYQFNKAYELYLNWWNTHKNSDFETFRYENPLYGSEFFWK